MRPEEKTVAIYCSKCLKKASDCTCGDIHERIGGLERMARITYWRMAQVVCPELFEPDEKAEGGRE